MLWKAHLSVSHANRELRALWRAAQPAECASPGPPATVRGRSFVTNAWLAGTPRQLDQVAYAIHSFCEPLHL